jgi:hypothetical protein
MKWGQSEKHSKIKAFEKTFRESFSSTFFQKGGEVKGEKPLSPSAEGEIPLHETHLHEIPQRAGKIFGISLDERGILVYNEISNERAF